MKFRSWIVLPLFLLYSIYCNAQKEEIIDSSYQIMMSDSIKLEGTLLFNPSHKHLIILHAGSGPTDRNGNNSMMTNNSLKYLAEGLYEKGINTFRFDKRGIAKSGYKGFNEADMKFSRLVEDLKEIVQHFDSNKFDTSITLAGHSEGSLISLLASRGNEAINSFISLAGPGLPADVLLVEQIGKQAPMLQEPLKIGLDSLKAGHAVKDINPMLMSLLRPSIQAYIQEWISHDPAEVLSQLDIPTLAIQGTNDIQVTTKELEILVANSPNTKKVLIENMNHIFKIIEGDTNENFKSYNDPELAISDELVPAILAFINSL